MPRARIYTKTGDDGTTGLFYGGRVRKDSELPTAYGAVDEAQAVLGLARAHGPSQGEFNDLIISLERDLWVLMAELATRPDNRHKLAAGSTAVSVDMVERLERAIDDLDRRFDPPTEFVVPGEAVVAAWLDLARTVVRRAERHALAAAPAPSLVGPYLNRLSDLLWTMARWQEGESRTARSVGAAEPTSESAAEEEPS
jgi:cob(I)alamin adenosyltransferase